MDIERAINISELWEAGKMIGANGSEVRKSLYKEVIKLRDDNSKLKLEYYEEWLINHDSRCANLHTCSTFTPFGNKCRHPLPESLKDQP